jgi:hypothetical protein
LYTGDLEEPSHDEHLGRKHKIEDESGSVEDTVSLCLEKDGSHERKADVLLG